MTYNLYISISGCPYPKALPMFRER